VFLTVDSQSSSVPPSLIDSHLKWNWRNQKWNWQNQKWNTHLYDPPVRKKTNVGQFPFFQKKEQVGKARIFGSLTDDYHQV
jgi:hypothetical protein